MPGWLIAVIVIGGIFLATALYDLLQRDHTILRNFPIIGRFRYMLEAIGPELRQYIVTNNEEERPFNRAKRRWIYASAKRENPLFGFGTDQDPDRTGYLIIKHSSFPLSADINSDAPLPCAKVLGEWRGRSNKFRPSSVVNISGMSFGSLSGPAVEAMNKGAALAGCLQNTGEGGISDYHRCGGEIVFQIGTGYFGCRNPDGTFSSEALLASLENTPVRAIELKLSQGAKPGLGGLLPGAKVTPEIARARGVPRGQSVRSPNAHSSFHDIDGLIDFTEELAELTGLPVGIKSAVGVDGFWNELARRMSEREEGPDFITVDGGEGGTGAGPLVFSDHVALPFRRGFARVYMAFAKRGMHRHVVFIGSGKLGFAHAALAAMCLGADLINVGREAMLAIGCVQAQRCHTDRCPTGVTTHKRWLTRGLDPNLKAVRCANYIVSLRSELLQLAHSCGYSHPALVETDALELLQENPSQKMSLQQHYCYPEGLERFPKNEKKIIEGLCEAAVDEHQKLGTEAAATS